MTEYIPTPAEIAAECLKIQSEWTAAERRRRRRGICDRMLVENGDEIRARARARLEITLAERREQAA